MVAKEFQPYERKSEVDQFWRKKEHMTLQRLQKDPSIINTKADKGNITTVLDKEWYDPGI